MRASGIATVMFTDLEASTDTTTRLGDEAAAELFAGHDRIVREQLAAHGGHSVHSTGDGFLALFDSARSAVACALAIQRELAGHDSGVRVRIGLNAGEVQEADDGALFGAAINLASRVMDRAHGGEILLTDTVRQLAGTLPGARFRDRGRAVLKGFPERQHLYAVEPPEGAIPTRAPPRNRPRRSRLPLIAAGLAAAAVGCAAILLATRGAEAVDVAPNSVAVIDLEEGRVVEQLAVGKQPAELAVSGGSVWVGKQGDNTVTRIGARSRRVMGTDSPGIDLDGLGAGPSGVWVADDERSLARVIEPEFRTVAHTYRLPVDATHNARPVAVTADAAWISFGHGVARIDPGEQRVAARIPLGNSPRSLVVGAGGVWVSDDVDGTVSRIDPATDEVVATIPVGASASGLAAGAGGVWVAVPLEDRVKRIDPDTNAIAETVGVGGSPAEVALGAGSLWVTSRRSGTVSRIDPEQGRVARAIPVGGSPQGVAVAGGAVWVAVQAGAVRAPAHGAADVLRVVRTGIFQGTDPDVFGLDPLRNATCALLLNHPDRPFPEGAKLVPEVAAEFPTASDGGRTYTFRVRPGFRFSPPSGAPVTAAAFARALERMAHPSRDPALSAHMGDIVGLRAYRSGRAKTIAGVSARGDRLTIRLDAPSATLPARLAGSTLCAVPPNTPISVPGVEPIPAAGPYYAAAYAPKRRLVLRRNPNYGGTRPARFRVIDVDLDVSDEAAATAVLQGSADYAPALPLKRLAAIDARFGPRSAAARTGRQRYFSGPAPVLYLFAFNRTRPLFAPRSARLAAAAAVDRTALASLVQVPSPIAGIPGRPTDQFVPSGLPGFRDVAVQPLGGPDPQAIARLAGDRRPQRATLYTCSTPPCLHQGRVARRNLAAIGIDLDVRAFSFEEMFRRLYTPGEPWDLAFYVWFPGFPDGADFIGGFFAPSVSGSSLPGAVPDAALERRIRAAANSPDAARARAVAALDAELSRDAAAIPFATGATTDFFSDRIGCQVHQPIYGISLGALCVRR